MNTGDRIKELRIKNKYTQEELANMLGLQKSAIAKYENGRVKNIKRSTLDKMSQIFCCSPSYLMGWEDEKAQDIFSFDNILPIKKKKIPLLGQIACGEPIYADEDRESYVEVGSEIRADFCLKAKGDSMINARILDGDIVFIKNQPIVENGEIAAVIIDDEATLKRVYYYPKDGKLILAPENSKYEPFIYIGDEINQIRILGKAIAFQSDVK